MLPAATTVSENRVHTIGFATNHQADLGSANRYNPSDRANANQSAIMRRPSAKNGATQFTGSYSVILEVPFKTFIAQPGIAMDLIFQWIHAARCYRKTTILAGLLVILTTVGVILFFPRTYRSRSQLLLRVGHENVSVDPTAQAAGQVVQMQLTRKNDIQTALQVMNSRALLGEVVDRVSAEVILDGLADDAEPNASGPGLLGTIKNRVGSMLSSIDPISDRERAIRDLAGNLDVGSANEASVVTAEYRAKSPEAAQLIMEAWLDVYLSKHAELHRTSGAHQFFKEEEVDLRSRLDETYSALRKAKTENGLVSVVGQQTLLEGQLATVRNSLIEVESLLASSVARSKSLRASLAETDNRTVIDEVSGKANEAHDVMRGRLV